MASWGRLNPLNILLRASNIEKTDNDRNDSDYGHNEGGHTNGIPSTIEERHSASNSQIINPLTDNKAQSSVQTLPGKSSIRSFFKRNRIPKEDVIDSQDASSAWSSPSNLRKSASFHHTRDTRSVDNTPKDYSEFLENTPSHRSGGSVRFPRTPSNNKMSSGSVRSILRDHKTPGTGSKVRFFSHETPSGSIDESTSGNGPNTINHPFAGPRENDEDDSNSFLSRLQEASLEEAASGNLSPKMSPLRSRRGLSADFFTPPTRSNTFNSHNLEAHQEGSFGVSDLSGASNASNPFNMSHDIQTIPIVDDGSVIMGSTSLEIPEDSGDVDPAHLLQEDSPRIGPISLTEAGQQFLSMNTSTTDSASSIHRPGTPGTFMDSRQQEGSTIFHSIAVNSVTTRGPLSPADSSSGISNNITSPHPSHSPSTTPFFTQQVGAGQNSFTPQDSSSEIHPSFRSRSRSISQEVALLRHQLSLQQDISLQFEADLSARDELVEILTDKVDSFSRQALRYKQEAERKDEKLRKTKQKIIDLKKSCDVLSDEIDRSRGEKFERSLFDEATGEALRVLQGKIKTLESEKRELEMKNLDFESRMEKSILDAAAADRSRLEDEVKLLRETESKLEAEIALFKEGNTVGDVSWREERSQLLQEKVESDDKVALLELEKAALTKTSDDLHKAITLKDKELHVLQREVEAQWANTEKSEDALTSLKTQMKELGQIARKLNEEKEKAELELRERENQIKEMEDVINDLHASNEALEVDAHQRWRSREDDQGNETRGMGMKMDELEAEMEMYRNERDALKEELAEAEHKCNDAVKEAKELKQTVEQLTASREEVEQEIYLIQEDLQEERQARQTAEKSLAALDAQRASVESEQSFTLKNIKKLEDLLKDRDHELADTNNRIDAYEVEIEDLKEEIRTYSRDHHQVEDQARQIDDLRKKDMDLRSDMEELVKSKAKLEATIAKLESTVRAAREENEAMKGRMRDLQKDNADKEMQIVQLERGRDLDREDKEGLNIALDTKQQELEMLKRKIGVRGTAGSTPAPSRIRESLGFGTTMSQNPALGLTSKSKLLDDDSANESAPETYPLRTSIIGNGGIKSAVGQSLAAGKQVRLALDGTTMLPSIRARPRSSLASIATPTPAATSGQSRPLAAMAGGRRPAVGPAAALPINRRASVDMEKTPTASNFRRAMSPAHGVEESAEGSSDEKENRRPRSSLSASVGSTSAIRSKLAAPAARKTSAPKVPSPLLA